MTDTNLTQQKLRKAKPENWKHLKSYKSVANLEKALDKMNILQFRPICVGVPGTTRVTAIFSLAELTRADVQFIAIVELGFMAAN